MESEWGVDKIHLAPDRHHLRTVVDSVMNLRFNKFTSWVTISVSKGSCSMELVLKIVPRTTPWDMWGSVHKVTRILKPGSRWSTWSVLTFWPLYPLRLLSPGTHFIGGRMGPKKCGRCGKYCLCRYRTLDQSVAGLLTSIPGQRTH
jgi:hypothetical protein